MMNTINHQNRIRASCFKRARQLELWFACAQWQCVLQHEGTKGDGPTLTKLLSSGCWPPGSMMAAWVPLGKQPVSRGAWPPQSLSFFSSSSLFCFIHVKNLLGGLGWSMGMPLDPPLLVLVSNRCIYGFVCIISLVWDVLGLGVN